MLVPENIIFRSYISGKRGEKGKPKSIWLYPLRISPKNFVFLKIFFIRFLSLCLFLINGLVCLFFVTFLLSSRAILEKERWIDEDRMKRINKSKGKKSLSLGIYMNVGSRGVSMVFLLFIASFSISKRLLTLYTYSFQSWETDEENTRMKEIRKTNVRIRKEYKVFKCDISFTRNVYILWIRRTTSIGKMNKQRSHSCNIRKCINQAQLLFRISSQNKYLILLHESYKLWIFLYCTCSIFFSLLLNALGSLLFEYFIVNVLIRFEIACASYSY